MYLLCPFHPSPSQTLCIYTVAEDYGTASPRLQGAYLQLLIPSYERLTMFRTNISYPLHGQTKRDKALAMKTQTESWWTGTFMSNISIDNVFGLNYLMIVYSLNMNIGYWIAWLLLAVHALVLSKMWGYCYTPPNISMITSRLKWM